MFIFAASTFLMMVICFLIALALVCWVYGIFLSLRASFLLFCVCFLFHLPFVIFGLVKLVAGVDIPTKICTVLRD